MNPSLIDFKALYQAWLACQKRKAGKSAAQKYEMRLLDHLWDTLTALQTAQYQVTASYCFVTTQPKLREIHAARFSDRVVHHYLVPKLEVLWEPWFIYDVYSNRKNKGTHKAVARCREYMRKSDAQFFLQLDIKNFFYTIQHKVLLALLHQGLQKACRQHKINQQQVRFYFYLCQLLIQADFQGVHQLNPHLAQKLPLHKQLKHQPQGQGLPIGNLTSQFFANVYLNELDQFIKHQLKCRYYIRFVDDFVLLANCEQTLLAWQNKIEDFLAQRLGLTLKAEKKLKPVQQGANFLGYIVRPHYTLVRNRVAANLKNKLTVLTQKIQQQGNVIKLKTLDIEHLRAVLASYIGHFKHAHSLKLIQSLWQHHPWLNYFFAFNQLSYQLEAKTRPHSMGFKQQVEFFRAAYPQAKLYIQLGRMIKTYQPHSGKPQFKVYIQQVGYNRLGIRQREVSEIKFFNPVLNH